MEQQGIIRLHQQLRYSKQNKLNDGYVLIRKLKRNLTMIKKMFGWALFIGMTAVLVFGAVNRTQAIAGERGTSAGNQGLGRAQDLQDNRQQNGSQGQGQSKFAGVGDERDDDQEWFNLRGHVSQAAVDALTITTADGSDVDISGKAWSYAQGLGFSPTAGDHLQMVGFYETPDHMEISELVNLTNNERVVLRDENGRPMWAGWRRGS